MLCDIGNTFLHFFDGEKIIKEPLKNIHRYKDEEVFYISVNRGLESVLKDFKKWHNLERFVRVDGEYEGMGVDRRALCMAVDEGVIVDAGSAVTVDLMQNGIYGGGFIYPGLWRMRECYAGISPVLDVDFVEFSPTKLPKDTRSAVSYGAIVPLVTAINSLGKSVYLTGGDADILHRYLPRAQRDDRLIFKGMKKAKEEYDNSSFA